MVKVSVLVPVYNVEKYLRQCLDSIIGQTLSDIEIICVNDGSTDGSLEILREYEKRDGRIKIIDKPNGGLPSARNAGLDAASGEYVSFVDSDDYIQPNMLSALYANAGKTGAEIVICGANVFPETPRADGWVYSVLSPRRKFYEKGGAELLFDDPSTRPFIWRTFVKKELIDRSGFRLNEDIHIGEDNAFQLRIYPKANGVSVIPDKLYNYRWYRKDSMMNTVVYKDVNKKTLSHIKMVLHVAEEWKKSGDMEKMGLEFFKWSVEFLYGDFIALPLELRISEGRRLVNMWTDCGCIRHKAELPVGAAEMTDYFLDVSRESAKAPILSVVMVLDKDCAELRKTLSAWLECETEDLELLLVNNARSVLNDDVICKSLRHDFRVRVIYAPNDVLSDAYNKALVMCTGEYIRFADPNLSDIGKVGLKNDFGGAEYDVIISGDGGELSDCFLKRGFIENSNIRFGDWSIESKAVFLTEIALAGSYVLRDGETSTRASRKYVSGLKAEDCVKILRSFSYRLELAQRHNNAELHNEIFSALSDDFYTELILSCVYPEDAKKTEQPTEIVTELLKLTESFSPEMMPNKDPPALPLIYVRLVDKLHKKISDISDIYQII